MDYSDRTDKPVKTDQGKSSGRSAKQNGDLIGEKSQETEVHSKPKGDLTKACYINAKMDDVYVYVIEFADPDRVLEKVIYEGTILKGQKQLIKSSSGKIQFDYRSSSDDRTYGDNKEDCVNGNAISIP